MLDRVKLAEYAERTPTDISNCLLRLHDLAVGAQNVLEIGVRRGESTKAFLVALKQSGGQLVSVDLNPPDMFPPAAFEELAATHWTMLVGDSLKVELPRNQFDLIFIDSGHTFDLTLAELERFAPMTSLIVLHDIIPKKPFIQVSEAIDAFREVYPGEWGYERFEEKSGLGTLRRVR